MEQRQEQSPSLQSPASQDAGSSQAEGTRAPERGTPGFSQRSEWVAPQILIFKIQNFLSLEEVSQEGGKSEQKLSKRFQNPF